MSLFGQTTGYTSVITEHTILDVDRNRVELEGETKSILVVDDDKAILTSAKAILKAEGYAVDTAETGREAIERSNARHYNLALLDIKLPDIEGTELLAKMATTVPRMRKVMITGYPSLENAVRSLKLGADDYVIKPIDPKTLLEIIKKRLKDQEAEELTLEAVEETLQTLLGSDASCLIYDYLESRWGISKEGIPARIDEFRNHLEELMGKRASKVIIEEIEKTRKTIISVDAE